MVWGIDKECFRYSVIYYGVYPVYSVSALLNVLVLFAWNAETVLVYYPTTYLFKMLAITDILQTLCFLIQYPIDWFNNIEIKTSFAIVTNSHRKINVYVTLVLALTRLFKIMPSLHADRLCSRPRMRIAVIVVSILGITLADVSLNLNSAYYNCGFDEDTKHNVWTVNDGIQDNLGYSVPALLQILVMFVVLWRLRKVIGKRQTEEHLHAMKRLTYTVFAVCFFTFLTHFVMRVFYTVVRDNKLWTPGETDILDATISLMIGINGLVNLIFYSLLVPRFRQLAKLHFERCARFFTTLSHTTVFPAAQQRDPAEPTTKFTIGSSASTAMAGGTLESLGTGKTSVKALPPTAPTTDLTEMTETTVD